MCPGTFQLDKILKNSMTVNSNAVLKNPGLRKGSGHVKNVPTKQLFSVEKLLCESFIKANRIRNFKTKRLAVS